MEKRKFEKDWQYIQDQLLTECINSNQFNNFHKLSNKDKIKFCISNDSINVTLSSFIEYIKNNEIFEKSSDVSNEYREKGNKFASPKPLDALNAYNKSILFAPKNSEEISLAYGNRSAVLFFKKNYKACVSDIDEALKFVSGDKMREIKLLIRKGKAMFELNEEGSLKTFIRAAEVIKNFKKEQPLENEKLDKFAKEIDDILRDAMAERVKIYSENKMNRNDSASADAYLADIKKNFVQNSELKNSSDKVKLENSKGKGRYVVANNDLSPGDVLFIEKPFAFVTLPDPNHSTCQNCCETNIDNPIACDFCAKGSYCSEECKIDAQKEFHYLECGFGLDMMYYIGGIAHLAFRVAILGTREKNSLNYKRVNDLVNNLNKMKADDVFMYTLTASLLVIILNDHTDFFKVKTNLSSKVDKELENVYNFGAVVLEHIGHLVCNSHAIIDYKTSSKKSDGIIIHEEPQRIGTGIFPSASMLNHSCDPTIHASFIKNTLIIKSIKDMKKGSEIFNCYGPNFRRMTTKERQEALLGQYHFGCDCWACISENEFTEKFKTFYCPYCSSKMDLRTSICTLCKTKHDEFDKAITDGENALKEVISLLDNYEFESACDLLRRTAKILGPFASMLNITMANITAKLASVLVLQDRFSESFHVAEKLTFIHVMEKYGKNSIEVGNEICKISDLGVEIVNNEVCVVEHRSTLKRCKVYCEVGMHIFDIHYGPYHDKYKALKEKAAFLKQHCD